MAVTKPQQGNDGRKTREAKRKNGANKANHAGNTDTRNTHEVNGNDNGIDNSSNNANGVDHGHQGKHPTKGDEQYFAANPQSADVRRERKVTLRGYDATVQTSNGVFSGNRVDLGTSVLLRHAPMPPQQGTGLDLGCGWGPIALALGFESPDLDIWAIDINERAVDLTAENAKSNGLEHVHAVTSDAVPADLTFDVIWSNPPIRIGKDALHELLMAWLPRLNPGGAAYLVVQKNLGSDSLIPWLAQALGDGYSVSKYASSKGYRVIEVLRQA